MADRYAKFVNSKAGGFVAPKLGLPQPARLSRHEPGRSGVATPALVGAAPGGRLAGPVTALLRDAGVAVKAFAGGGEPSFEAAEGVTVWDQEHGEKRFQALVFDATGIASSDDLRELWEFFHPSIRRVARCGRIVVLGTQPELCPEPRVATAQRALEGFTRAAAKEARRGATAQLVYVEPGAEDQIESTLRFLLSAKSAYVSGQVVRVTAGRKPEKVDWERPLEGKVALVTGASRGIGAAIASTLARDGAHVIGLDVPALADDMDAVANGIGGSALAIDITAADAPKEICDYLEERHGGVDVVVHNAGVTRDKTLGRMDEDKWTVLLDINLSSEERVNSELLARKLIRAGGRVVCVSSISGIAGNAGQTNYATSKAGVIGMVQSMAPVFAKRRATINAVAPGFIETQMTAAMPIGIREAGRRMNSLSQGGLPVDVAETIAWFASPASTGLNGNVVRVCGQSLLGA